MGKAKKRFNSKALIPSEQSTAHQPQDTVSIDLNIREEQYDSSNPLVLLSKNKKKLDYVEKSHPAKKTKPLSNKRKKHLQKILEKKKRHINRAEILEKLQKVQATSEELKLMISTASMQTSGLKRYSTESSEKTTVPQIRSIRIKRRTKKEKDPLPKKKIKLDPNIVGYDEDSDDSESISENEVENNELSNKEDGTTLEKSKFPEAVNDITENCQNKNLDKNASAVKEPPSKKPETSSVDTTQPALNTCTDTLKDSCQPAIYIPVNRLPEIQAAREALPIYLEEQAIMEAIRENAVVVIHGATGTGKTTQVPQFLYEAGYTREKQLIGITEPRRIAAVSMAARVGEEMNMPDVVSYHIRYEKTVTDDKTEIKFMTDGVLLKEIRRDFLLTRYSVIIIDEAHERSVFSDVLIGLLSRIIPLREKKGKPLKLIIMSATLRVEDFTENTRLFKQKPHLIILDSRQYDVAIHFNTKTPEDYIDAAYKKVCKIHRQLPVGAILVFVTGEKEVTKLCNMLRKAFPFTENKYSKNQETEEQFQGKQKKWQKFKKNKRDESDFDQPPKIDLDSYSIEPLDNEGLQHQQSDGEEDMYEELEEELNVPGTFQPLYVLPLYSLLPSEEQAKIFKPPPPDSRLCVVATNVAETSLTIPFLKYVVDTGKVKTREYDLTSEGISNFIVTWTSKASANQRAGRAGRTEGGHCYRLYSSAIFEHSFSEFSSPEIQKTPVDDVLLQMKALGIDRVVNFPFPSSPCEEALKTAEKRLVMLGALQDLQKVQRYKDIAKWEYSAKVTPMGKAMSRFPLSPRYAKMLLLSHNHDVIPHTIALVSAMTVPELFLSSVPSSDQDDDGKKEENQKLCAGIKKIAAGTGQSLLLGDVMIMLRAIALFEKSINKTRFCERYGMSKKAMMEIRKMRLQLIREMNNSFIDVNMSMDLDMDPPTDEQLLKLRKIMTSSLNDHVARKIPDQERENKLQLRNAYKCLDSTEPIFIHPSSVLSSRLPEFIVYKEIIQTSKLFMKTVVEIEPEWLTTGCAQNQCEFSQPLQTPEPYYDKKTDRILCCMTSTFGRWSWPLPRVMMPMPVGITKYNWFCFFLLDGQVCPFFNEHKKHLLSPASVMLKAWSRLLQRARNLLQAVIDKEVDSKGTLYKIWENDPKYLIQEYCEWLSEEKHMEVACQWPPPCR